MCKGRADGPKRLAAGKVSAGREGGVTSEETKVGYGVHAGEFKVLSIDFLYPTQVARPDPHQLMDIKRHYEGGGALADDALPTKLHDTLYDIFERQKSRLPHVFKITGGYLLISEKLHNVLAGCDLGATRMIPVELFEYDKVMKRPERLFLLNVAERKGCFLPEASEGPRLDSGGTLWSPFLINPVMAIRAEAALSVDLWLDPKLLATFFFSDRLVRAMQNARITWSGLKPAVLVA